MRNAVELIVNRRIKLQIHSSSSYSKSDTTGLPVRFCKFGSKLVFQSCVVILGCRIYNNDSSIARIFGLIKSRLINLRKV